MMLWLLLGLAGLSILLLLTGFVWVLLQSGKTTRRRGADVGRELMADRVEEHDETTLVQKSAFRGQAASARSEASIRFVDIKNQIKRGQWNDALPALLAISGILGLLLFGSLALFVALDDKLVGGLIAIVGVFSTLRVIVGMARA